MLRYLNFLDHALEVILVSAYRWYRSSWYPKFLLLVSVLIMTGTVGSQYFVRSDLLVNRVWVDRLPEDLKDKFSLYVFTDEEAADNVFWGIHLSGIPAKYVTEAMVYNLNADGIRFYWPADESRNQTQYKAVKEKNGEFDLKLTVQSDPRHGGTAHVYYSSTEWESIDNLTAIVKKVTKK